MKTFLFKEAELKQYIAEAVEHVLIKEAFKSNMLRNFFKQHGVVDKNRRQFSLGDLDDTQIGFAKEYPSHNDAANALFNMKRPTPDRKRSKYDMKYVFEIFHANDGTALLVGINRNAVKTGIHWGGEHLKKVTDRLWNNNRDF